MKHRSCKLHRLAAPLDLTLFLELKIHVRIGVLPRKNPYKYPVFLRSNCTSTKKHEYTCIFENTCLYEKTCEKTWKCMFVCKWKYMFVWKNMKIHQNECLYQKGNTCSYEWWKNMFEMKIHQIHRICNIRMEIHLCIENKCSYWEYLVILIK